MSSYTDLSRPKEFATVLACCRVDSDAQKRAFLLDTVRDPEFDESALLAFSHRHGVLPLVYRSMKELADREPSFPVRTLESFRSHYRQIAQKNILLASELIRLQRLAEERGIPLLPFKGPLLAQIAYGDLTLRQFSDLDILVRRQDFRPLAEILTRRNFVPYFPIERYREDRVLFDLNNDCPFYDRKRGIAIELHWEFFRKLALPTAVFAPWAETRRVTLNGVELHTLKDETHLLYHSLHGSKHLWERLIWIVDIDRFLRECPDLDWEEILSKARRLGARKMFLLGIFLANELLATPLPDPIQKACEPLRGDPIVTYVLSELQSTDPTPEESLIKWKKIVALRDDTRHKILTVLEFLFRPGINERRTVILPDRWFWLYWPLRPLGAGGRFVSSRLFGADSDGSR